MEDDNNTTEAMSLWLRMMHFVIAMLIIFSVGYKVYDVITGDYKLKSYLAEDISLYVGSLHNMKGSAVMLYDGGEPAFRYLNRYIYSFHEPAAMNKNKVVVKGRSDPSGISYPYVADPDFVADTKLPNPDAILFVKHSDHLKPYYLSARSDGKGSAEISLSPYYAVRGFTVLEEDKHEHQGYILVDPGHGSADRAEDTGNTVQFNGKVVKEEDITKKIALVSGIGNSRVKYSRSVSEGIAEHRSLEERISSADDKDVLAVVSIHVGMSDSNVDAVNVFISSSEKTVEESRKIAALILNQIEEDSDETYDPDYLSINVVDPATLPEDDAMKILSVSKPAVYIEFGNINLERSVSRKNILKLGSSLKKALKKYLVPEND